MTYLFAISKTELFNKTCRCEFNNTLTKRAIMFCQILTVVIILIKKQFCQLLELRKECSSLLRNVFIRIISTYSKEKYCR